MNFESHLNTKKKQNWKKWDFEMEFYPKNRDLDEEPRAWPHRKFLKNWGKKQEIFPKLRKKPQEISMKLRKKPGILCKIQEKSRKFLKIQEQTRTFPQNWGENQEIAPQFRKNQEVSMKLRKTQETSMKLRKNQEVSPKFRRNQEISPKLRGKKRKFLQNSGKNQEKPIPVGPSTKLKIKFECLDFFWHQKEPKKIPRWERINQTQKTQNGSGCSGRQRSRDFPPDPKKIPKFSSPAWKKSQSMPWIWVWGGGKMNIWGWGLGRVRRTR